MSRFNTGNPLGSGSPLDLDDNAKNLDEAVNAEQDTFQDRMGKSRLSWAGIVKAGSGDPAIAVDAAARAEAAASSVEQDAEQIAQDAAEQAAADVVDGVEGQVVRAESAADRAESASDAAFVNADVYPDITAGLAAVADGEQFQVVEGDEIVRYRRDSASTQTEVAKYPTSESVFYLREHSMESVPGKNLIDPKRIRANKFATSSSLTVGNSTSYRCTGFIPVKEGAVYTYSGYGVGSSGKGVFFTDAVDTAGIESIGGSGVFTVPEGLGIKYVVLNVTNQGGENLEHDHTVQLEIGNEATDYEAYGREIPIAKISGIAPVLERLDEVSGMFSPSKNLINPDEIRGGFWVSVTNFRIRPNSSQRITGFIPVKEGTTYTYSGYNLGTLNRGGYFSDANDDAGVALVGSSYANDTFTVPIGMGIKYVVLAVTSGSSEDTSNDHTVQLEIGNEATDYVPFSYVTIPVERVHGIDEITEKINPLAWYRYLQSEEGGYNATKIPKFRSAWLKREKDLMVVVTGSSSTAYGTNYYTNREGAPYLAPLMDRMDTVSYFWDALKWDNQHYRRFDAAGFFTESGSFVSDDAATEWDVLGARHLTRYSDSASASVQFQAPADAWQFNLIYRTDTVATEAATISIAEGDGMMEAFRDSTGQWEEANGFVFSMRESAPTPRDISAPSPRTGDFYTATVETKSNTTFQKRLKMRCKSPTFDSRGEVKNITLTKGDSGRLLYWGVEWSLREFMITVVNSARGSHGARLTGGAISLLRKADNEVWGFKPDLIIAQVAMANDGAHTPPTPATANGFWGRTVNNYVFRTDYELSIYSKAAALGLDLECVLYFGQLSRLQPAFREDGTLNIGENSEGKMMTALDNYQEAYNYVVDNHPDTVAINSAKYFYEAGQEIYGSAMESMRSSPADGSTLSRDGTHPNNNGAIVLARCVLPTFRFTR